MIKLSWQLWKPAIQPLKRLDVLVRHGQLGDEHSNAYAHVFDLSPGGEEDQSGEVVRFTFHYRGLSAAIIKSGSSEFLTRNRQDWGFDDLPLVKSDLIEQLVEALKEISTPTCSYRFYTRNSTVIIVRELIVEPEVAVAVEKTEAVPDWDVCPRTGQPHVFIATTPLPVIGGPFMANSFQLCQTCHSVFYTQQLPVCVDPIG